MPKQEAKLRDLLFQRQGGYCHYCGKMMRAMPKFQNGPISKRTVTLEHLLPRSRGGITSVENCVAVHRECNEARGNMPLEQWDAILIVKLESMR